MDSNRQTWEIAGFKGYRVVARTIGGYPVRKLKKVGQFIYQGEVDDPVFIALGLPANGILTKWDSSGRVTNNSRESFNIDPKYFKAIRK